jgi:hypothetical protein
MAASVCMPTSLVPRHSGRAFGIMNICPHCHALANPLRLLSMSRRAPYRCSSCGGRSLLQPKHNTVAGFLTLGVGISCALALSSLGIFKTIACFLGLYVIFVGGIMWLFMRLQPVQK